MTSKQPFYAANVLDKISSKIAVTIRVIVLGYHDRLVRVLPFACGCAVAKCLREQLRCVERAGHHVAAFVKKGANVRCLPLPGKGYRLK